MSEKEKKIAETFKKVLPELPEGKKEYLLGLADGMAVMADRQKKGVEPANLDAG